MRTTAALVLTLALIFAFTPVHAEEEEERTEELGHSFGKAYCRGAFICPHALSEENDMGRYYVSIFTKANRCVRQNFGVRTPAGGFFENEYLNNQSCLTTKPLPPAADGGTHLAPNCCIIAQKQNPNLCTLICTLNETR